ncbi:ABC transporter permease [Mesorhizobium sp. MSK_1335]|uniref:ABC transporter permease n=1 Tax=Mesorhizobium montanum TaxID=3072323 RepID=A0ABU4ZV12_9HYPH|nr:ABC transporter permease [Mesorhizobium sp. MSK_1335]MDX8529205.1 ABC transporter permease [Mesorhizobium sp. MSK_1335]
MGFLFNSIFKMITRRIALGFLSLMIVSLIIFFAVSLLPGDFATAVLGRSATQDAVAAFQQQLGLDRPLYQRYFHWLSGALIGDFGNSFSMRPVAKIIGPRLLNTLVLAGTTAIIAVPLAVMLGVICARFRNRLPDRVLSAVTLASISVPEFFIAYLLMLALATKFQIFPSLSSVRPGMGFLEQAHRMALPIMTLLFVVLAHMMRNTRAAIINVMSRPFIEMAQLKGEPEMRIILTHALPNAIGSIASVVAINLAYLIAGVVVIEVVFVYPGIGQTMVDAVRNRDVPVIQACALIFSATYILLNLFADIISITSDPRLLHPR